MQPKNRGGGNRPPQQQKAKTGIESKPRPKTTDQARSASRGEAIRAQRRTHDDATRMIGQYNLADSVPDVKQLRRANQIDDQPRLKIVGLGGMDGGGSKNMMLVEYKDDAVVIDAGSDLGVDLPGINYGICDISYLEAIKHKVKA